MRSKENKLVLEIAHDKALIILKSPIYTTEGPSARLVSKVLTGEENYYTWYTTIQVYSISG